MGAYQMKPILDQKTYELERAICDKASSYRHQTTRGKRNYLTAEEAAHPDYAACDNVMRGRVEQYELLADTPSEIFAYIGKPEVGRYPVQTWTGLEIGFARVSSSWRVHSHIGSHQYQFYALINGREFTGRGFGEGMCIRLKETANSKRERKT